jgi:carboxyl-terminal processing protease
MNYSEAINKIRGSRGTEVTLSILHDGDIEPTDIKVTRDKVVVKSVKWEVKNNDIMYIRISQFGDDTFDLVNQAIDEVSSKGIKKVIVDVRDDPGGYLEKCIDITSLFISEGVVVKEEDRNGKIIESMTTHLPRLNDAKVVVLINGGSASASEIFAGAIQDHQRGLLIGEKSFGKGSVQNLETLKDGSQVKITIAKWLTPNGKAIDKEGIKPDIEVKVSDEDIKNNNDVQLQKAIEEVSK